jgi:hypothetical protein
MEWLGTGFVLNIGAMRLRVRIALEDIPLESGRHGKAPTALREEREYDGPRRRTYRVHTR